MKSQGFNMANYTCKQTCQVRMDDGSIRLFERGQVHDFDVQEPPKEHFDLLDDVAVDFENNTEAELMATKWTLKQANEACKALFGKELVRGSKKDLVSQILDMRLRKVD